jgi:hypothetical protein
MDIPVKIDDSYLTESNEVLNLKNELIFLEENKKKLITMIENLFSVINNDVCIPQMLNLLKNKTTEENIFKENVYKYDELLTQLSQSNIVVLMNKSNITDLNKKYINLRNKFNQPNETINNVLYFLNNIKVF